MSVAAQLKLCVWISFVEFFFLSHVFHLCFTPPQSFERFSFFYIYHKKKHVLPNTLKTELKLNILEAAAPFSTFVRRMKMNHHISVNSL